MHIRHKNLYGEFITRRYTRIGKELNARVLSCTRLAQMTASTLIASVSTVFQKPCIHAVYDCRNEHYACMLT